MVKHIQQGHHYSENIVSQALTFNNGTWTVVSGRGTASLNANTVFAGTHSLYLQNNDPVKDVVASNSNQSTVIETSGNYQLSLYARKDVPKEARSIEVLVYQNNVLLDTQRLTLENINFGVDTISVDNVWQRYQADREYSFKKGDSITFQFVLNGTTTLEATTSVFIDGFMLNKAERNNAIAPAYTQPQRLKNVPNIPTLDGDYKLSIVNGNASWVLIP